MSGGQIIGPVLPPHLRPVVDKIDSDEEEDMTEKKSSTYVLQSYGPQLPPHLVKSKDEEATDIGPKLPPHLLNKRKLEDGDLQPGPSSSSSAKSVKNGLLYGPSVPSNMKTRIGPTLPPGKVLYHQEKSYLSQVEEDEDGDMIGPSIHDLVQPGESDNRVAEDFEKRSKTMKDKLTKKDEIETPQREEWMTELPSLMGKKIGLGLGPRTFNKRSVEPTTEKDRSGWTETPNDIAANAKQNEHTEEVEEDQMMSSEELSILRKNATITKNLEKFNSSKRAESLMDIHKKKLKRKAAKEESKIARREFDRDKDLNSKNIDTALTKSIADRAKLFNTRFSHGSNHFL